MFPDCAVRKFKKAKKIAVIGNGGNLAIAQHAASDFQRHTNKHCFAPDAVHLTALGGDGSWHKNWIDNMKDKCDLFIGITTRLNSPIAEALPKQKSLLIAPKKHPNIPTIVVAKRTYHEFEVQSLWLCYCLMELSGVTLPAIEQ